MDHCNVSGTKYIFVTGGVISGIGKGVISASIGAILKAMDVTRLTIKKLDPYLNVDPGTMNPVEHGEVYVTDDGAETDLDLGYYERFTGLKMSKINSTSSGKLYMKLLDKERSGEFLGKTVQIVPHLTDEIKGFIRAGDHYHDVIICEIGGSIGDIEAMAFYESLRQLRNEMPESIMFVHVTYLVNYITTNELKTKPTQNAIKELNSSGIYPDILVCRTENAEKVDDAILNKLAMFTNVPKKRIVISPDVESIYTIPLILQSQELDCRIAEHFKLPIGTTNMNDWRKLCGSIKSSSESDRIVKIGIIGKYVELHDSYKSLIEAIHHAGIAQQCRVELLWINSRHPITHDTLELLKLAHGFVVPGGFGDTGIENMIQLIHTVRAAHATKPLLGICLGMQLMCIEFARNVMKLKDAGSAEFGTYENNIIKIMIDEEKLGGTMRLGSHKVNLDRASLVHNVYSSNTNENRIYHESNKEVVYERHRHRYDVNPEYAQNLDREGLKISGTSDEDLVECIELSTSKSVISRYYVGVQFHPEYKSTPMNPHPLFSELVRNALIELDDE